MDKMQIYKGLNVIDRMQLCNKLNEKKKKIIIFDWDNTLFPKFLTKHKKKYKRDESKVFNKSIEDKRQLDYIKFVMDENYNKLNMKKDLSKLDAKKDIGKPDINKDLSKLDAKIVKVLSKLLSMPEVLIFIVTNSKPGWMEKTSKRYLPQTWKFIRLFNNNRNNFCAISARKAFEKIYPNDPIAWKICAFKRIIDEQNSGGQKISHFISLGDGLPEKIATRLLFSGGFDDSSRINGSHGTGSGFLPIYETSFSNPLDEYKLEVGHDYDVCDNCNRHNFNNVNIYNRDKMSIGNDKDNLRMRNYGDEMFIKNYNDHNEGNKYNVDKICVKNVQFLDKPKNINDFLSQIDLVLNIIDVLSGIKNYLELKIIRNSMGEMEIDYDD